MVQSKKIPIISISILLSISIYAYTQTKPDTANFITYQIDLKKQDLKLYWKNDKNELFRSLGNLKNWLASNKQTLVFAMNGGMYQPNNSPSGLFIQEKKTITPLNKRSGKANFYWKPNGVLYTTTDNIAGICKTEDFKNNGQIRFATQSGPMVVVDGQINPTFAAGSKNVNIRNGVGILPNNQLVFAMSKKEVSFYDFAKYFKDLGCVNALYLDGFVSRTYLPEKNSRQLDGDFGVIAGVTVAAP